MDEIILTNEEYKMFSEICASELSEIKTGKENSFYVFITIEQPKLIRNIRV